jgi:ATP-dependent Clp protease ATP-binding subunit ClpC
MKLALRLLAREHVSGAITLQVLGRADLVVFTEDLARGKEELGLAIADRIERTHPSGQASFSAPPELRPELLRLDDGLLLHGLAGPERRPLELTMLVSSRRGWTRVWFPRLDLHGWFPKKVDYVAAARVMAHAHVERLRAPQRLDVRPERREWLEPLLIEVEPAPLMAFRGKSVQVLPPPGSEPEEGEAEAEAAQAKARGEKVRPPTPTLARIGTPLSTLAQRGELERAHGRVRELTELEALLAARGHKAIVLVGQSGSGKSALVAELVARMVEKGPKDDVRPAYFADASRLVATSGMLSDWQRQTLDVIEECHASDVVWSIGSLVRLLDAGKHIYSEHNVAAVLRPYLAAKRVTVIGECTPAEWATLELRDVAFARCFIPYRLEDPPPAELRALLAKVAAPLFPGAELGEAVEAARELAARYLVRKSAVGAAVQLLRRAAEHAQAVGARTLTRADVCRHFATETGLPELIVRDDLALDPAAVRAFFEARLVGQPEAVARMVDLIAVIKAGLPDPRRPLGTFLFVGPTGVGKTESAKALAAFLYGTERRLVRFDMSEYVGYDAVSRFLGDARSEGKLVEAVRRQPFTVLLLDEIEKAHPAIFDVLLSVLGEARLTDEAGRTADFKNVVIVMTSNLGVETLKPSLGFAEGGGEGAAERAHFARAVEGFFRPELFNRIDHVVPFRPLPAAAIHDIAERQLALLCGREGLRQRGVTLVVPPDVQAFLAERGVDARYGARPLKRTIERRLAMPLARHLSSTRLSDVVLEVQVEGEALTFAPGKAKVSAERGTKHALEELHARAERLRFRLERWQESRVMRETIEEVRLLERLSASPKFWQDRELAEARVAGLEPKRQLLADVAVYERELRAVVQLLVEAHYRRDDAAVSVARDAVDGLATRLEPLELRMAGVGLVEPDSVTLTLLPGKGAGAVLRRLVRAYAQLADAQGWTIALHQGVMFVPQEQVLDEPTRPKTNPNARKANVKKAERAASGDEPPKPKGPKKPRPEVLAQHTVRWRALGERPPCPPDDDGDALTDKLWRELSPVDATALWVRGPGAAVWLRHEAGSHTVVEATETAEVRAAVQLGAAAVSLSNPVDLAASSAGACRTVHELRHHVIDHGAELTLATEARLSRVYRRLMRARMLLDALGPRARPWLRGWEEG